MQYDPDHPPMDELFRLSQEEPAPVWVYARFDGRCPACDERIIAGETLIRFDPDCDAWVCAACEPGGIA